MKLNGELAYVPQQAWIFSGTVKENVVFGETFDADRFGWVVEACALTGLVTNSILLYLHLAINEQCRKMGVFLQRFKQGFCQLVLKES